MIYFDAEEDAAHAARLAQQRDIFAASTPADDPFGADDLPF